jgi:magnesium-transporting ATPase (P-type)
VSTIAFTVIIHIIIYKLFLETSYWNPIMIVTCLVCFALYYGLIIIGNVNALSTFFQPQLASQVFMMLSSPKFWVLVIVIPVFALVPDMTWEIMRKVFYPTPIDNVKIWSKAKKNNDLSENYEW